MATIADLVSALADGLGVERSSVTVAARKLQLAGAVPIGKRGRHGGVSMGAEDATMLLLGVLGAPRVGLAPEAARAFAKLPAVAAVFQETDGARVTRIGHDIEDIPVGPGEGPGRTALTRTFGTALTDIIDAEAHGLRKLMAPTELGLMRHLSAPIAWMRFPILSPEGGRRSGEIFYASESNVADAWQREKLRHTASVDGAVLERLGEALQEKTNAASYVKRVHIGSGLIPLIPEGDFLHA